MLRARWHAPGEGGDSPVDRLLDLGESAVSVGVRQLCCRVAADARSFARAAGNLLHTAQVRVSEELLRQVVEGEGKAVLAAQEHEQLEIDWSAAQCRTAAPGGAEVSRVYASADGVMVPVTTAAEKLKRRRTVLRRRRETRRRGRRRPGLGPVKSGADQRYKQFNVTSFYDQAQSRRLVSVTRRGNRGSAKLLRRDAARLRVRAADERVGLVDGAPCLREQMGRLPLTALGLDFFHLSQHVHEAKRQTFGPDGGGGGEQGEAWAADVLHAARHGGYQPFWDKLVDWRGRQRGKAGRRAADALLHYVSERRGMINYDQFERRGWHVGTGPIESMCKVTTGRVKGPGMRWDADNAEAMMALEALHQSGQWEAYWATALHATN